MRWQAGACKRRKACSRRDDKGGFSWLGSRHGKGGLHLPRRWRAIKPLPVPPRPRRQGGVFLPPEQGTSKTDEPALERNGDRFGAVVDVELLKERLHVRLHRFLGNEHR